MSESLLKFLVHGGKIVAKGTFTVTFTVESAPLAVATPVDLGLVDTPLPAGVALKISGGVPPYTVTVDPSSPNPLPSGVTLAADGTLSGTPTAAGSTAVLLDVADSLG